MEKSSFQGRIDVHIVEKIESLAAKYWHEGRKWVSPRGL
jgi:hypothetical protein